MQVADIENVQNSFLKLCYLFSEVYSTDEYDSESDYFDCLYTGRWTAYDRLNILYTLSLIHSGDILFDGNIDFEFPEEPATPFSDIDAYCHSEIKTALLNGISHAYDWKYIYFGDDVSFWRCMETIERVKLSRKAKKRFKLSDHERELADRIKNINDEKEVFLNYLKANYIDITDYNLLCAMLEIMYEFPTTDFFVFCTGKSCTKEQLSHFSNLCLYDEFYETPSAIITSDDGNFTYFILAGLELCSENTAFTSSLKYFLNCATLQFFAH